MRNFHDSPKEHSLSYNREHFFQILTIDSLSITPGKEPFNKFVEGIMKSIHVKLFQNLTSGSGDVF